MVQPAFDSVLFDFDGILADSEPVHHWAWRNVLAGFGAELSWERYAARCIGRDLNSIIRGLSTISAGAASFEDLLAAYPGKIEACRGRMLAVPPLWPETVALLSEISVPLGVVTSNSREEVEPILIAAGIRSRFTAVVFREDVGRHKPAPDPWLRAAELLSTRRPLVVEDSEVGCMGAEAAGFSWIRVTEPRLVAREVRARLNT